jgi:hypothetical protein
LFSLTNAIYNPAIAHLVPRSSGKTKAAALADLADIVRATVPCPSVVELAKTTG